LAVSTPEQAAAARTLIAVGLAVESGGGLQLAPGLESALADGSLPARAEGMVSSLRQLAAVLGIVPAGHDTGWSRYDDETLLAQGRASAFGGRMLATTGVPAMDGLAERFSDGGRFLDIGVGVGELAAAFAETLLASHVVGIDVLPRALELARRTIEERGLSGRMEVRLQPVQELDDDSTFDLVWIPSPFIPSEVVATGIGRVGAALRPGGWLVIGAGRFEGDPLAVAVTRWKTVLSGGKPFPPEARAAVESVGLTRFTEIPAPPGAPALYAASRPA
jgi:SAM-dependent methyltransferase